MKCESFGDALHHVLGLNLARLAAVKSKYDSANVFRVNQTFRFGSAPELRRNIIRNRLHPDELHQRRKALAGVDLDENALHAQITSRSRMLAV